MPQVKLNNPYARNRIFEMYMKVAVRIALVHAKRYHLSLDETIQNGIGLDHECTLDEVGQKFDITRERVRQIEAKAMRKIRRCYGIKEDDKD